MNQHSEVMTQSSGIIFQWNADIQPLNVPGVASQKYPKMSDMSEGIY